MMTETCIKGWRQSMVGDYYEPYRVEWSEAINSLEDTYRMNDRTLGFTRRAHFKEVADIVEELEGCYEH